MKKEYAIDLIIRYFLLVLIAFSNLYILYAIFTPLTVYPVFWLLDKMYGALLLGENTIFFSGLYIELITACIAGAAYYLLLILNFTTPMELKRRFKSLIFLLLSFLALNIIRIIIFAILLKNGFSYFDITHEIVWYFGSTILVVLIWFANVFIFKIKGIPIYSDLKLIWKDIHGSKK